MNNIELRELLVEKYDYKNSQVDGVVKQITEFPPKVAAAFENWINTGEMDDTEVEGYTAKAILDKKPMKVVAAYLTLGWLGKDPIQAKIFLNKREIRNSAAQNKF